MNLPNKLTISRMIITPIYLLVLMLTNIPHGYLIATLIFAVAAITDAVDGKLARKNNQITVFGKLLDPVADKMLTTAAYLGFLKLGLCDVFSIMLILTREFAVTSVRLIASAQGIVIPANIWGKIKTVSQMVTIILVMLMGELRYCADTYGFMSFSFDTMKLISMILVWITVVLTVLSGIIYMVQAKKRIDFSK